MGAELQDVINAINSLGSSMSASAAASAPDSPEMIQRRMEGLNSENEALERQRRLIDQRAASAQRDADLRQNAIEQARNEEQVLQAVYDAQMANTSASAESRAAALENLETARAATDQLEDESAELDRNTQSREANNAAIQSMTSSVQNSMMAYQKHSVVNVANIVNMGKQIKKVGLLGAAQAAVTGILLAFVDSVLALTMETDKQTSALMRNTGATREQALAIADDVQHMASLGVEVGELTAAHEALRGTMTDFTRMSSNQQREIANTGALLAEQGVSLDDYAKGMQTGTKAFGMSGTAMAATSRELNSLATQIGVVPKQMAADFANSGGKLAKFGSDGVRAFKDLAIVSKSTGLSIDKLLKITDKFDTFEGAAEQAGMLNAALGGNFVNAMDLMMTTDPAERFGMIKDAIMNTGLSFDEMSYYQKKFYAEAAGLDDVNDLALLMSGNMDKLTASSKMTSDQIHDLEKRTEEFRDIGEKFKNLLRAFIPVMKPLIKDLRKIADELAKNETLIADITGLFKGMGTVLKFVAENFKLVAGAIVALGIGAIVIKLLLLAKALGIIGVTAPPVAGAIMGTVGPMLAFGGAAALVGAGIWMASEGIASMAKAFSGLDANAMAAVGVALLAMGAGIYFLGGASAAASGPLMALAFSVMMIGAGIGLAAAGIGLMGAGFGMMFEHADADKLQSLAGVIFYLASAIGILGGLGPVGAAGMGILAGGFLALGASIMMMEGSLTAFAQFTGNLSALTQDTTGLKEVATEIKAIADAIWTLPLMPTLALSTAFEHARASATVGAHSAAANRTAAAAPANQPPPKVEVKVYIEDVEVKPSKIETALNDIITPLIS